MKSTPSLLILSLLGLAACVGLEDKTARSRALLSRPRLHKASLRWPLNPFHQSLPRWSLKFRPESLPVVCRRELQEGTVPRLRDAYAYIAERRPMDGAQAALVLLGDQQKMYLVCHDQGTLWVDGVYAVSTAINGFAECGVEPHSTPVGLHVIFDKAGSGLAPGTILQSRLDSGQKAKISTDYRQSVTATVTSRALCLSGREPRNNETYEYQIYLHGTPREYSLGSPASSGCVRLRNSAVIELYDLLPTDTPVFIDGKPRHAQEI